MCTFSMEKKKKEEEKPVLPEEGRMRRGTLNGLPEEGSGYFSAVLFCTFS